MHGFREMLVYQTVRSELSQQMAGISFTSLLQGYHKDDAQLILRNKIHVDRSCGSCGAIDYDSLIDFIVSSLALTCCDFGLHLIAPCAQKRKANEEQ